MKAMMRDASWYACPGRADVYHVVVEINGSFFPACNTTLRHGHHSGHKGVILNEQTKIDARDARMRCERSGCKQKWPPVPKSLATWTDEELAAVLLSQLWRIYDAGGISDGRSYEAVLLEAAREIHPLKVPVGGEPGERPSDELLLREVARRKRDRFRARHGEP